MLIAGLLIVLFGLGGRSLLVYLGVSIDALRIAGGILLFKLHPATTRPMRTR